VLLRGGRGAHAAVSACARLHPAGLTASGDSDPQPPDSLAGGPRYPCGCPRAAPPTARVSCATARCVRLDGARVVPSGGPPPRDSESLVPAGRRRGNSMAGFRGRRKFGGEGRRQGSFGEIRRAHRRFRYVCQPAGRISILIDAKWLRTDFHNAAAVINLVSEIRSKRAIFAARRAPAR
jgi:hypothetical protein